MDTTSLINRKLSLLNKLNEWRWVCMIAWNAINTIFHAWKPFKKENNFKNSLAWCYPAGKCFHFEDWFPFFALRSACSFSASTRNALTNGCFKVASTASGRDSKICKFFLTNGELDSDCCQLLIQEMKYKKTEQNNTRKSNMYNKKFKYFTIFNKVSVSIHQIRIVAHRSASNYLKVTDIEHVKLP